MRKQNKICQLYTLLLYMGLCLPTCIQAQTTGNLKVTFIVCDQQSKQPLEYANVWMQSEKEQKGITTDSDGRCMITQLHKGKYQLRISYIGYDEYNGILPLSRDTTCIVSLKSNETLLQEVVVTASESKGITSASRINRKAMEHLQPSSFADITALLPGGVSTDPSSSNVNSLRLREAGGEAKGASGYETGALGTSFVIDGVPVQTDARMQYEQSSWENNTSVGAGRNSVGKGVDMRAISTDEIASVEIVRGIPSVEYGELTSGLVNITRKKGGNKLDARFKADMQSQLFYVGKGWEVPRKDLSFNWGLDYLDAKDDPRNRSENYKRITGSLRMEKKWHANRFDSRLYSSLNYNGMFEKDTEDPDLTLNGSVNIWESTEHKFSLNHTFTLNNRNKGTFRKFEASASITIEKDLLHREKTVATDRIYAVPTINGVGEHDAAYLPSLYEAVMDIKGLPFYAYAKAMTTFTKKWGAVDNLFKAGMDWKMDKNYGDGQVYDLSRPITPGSTSRPRAFSDIPAGHTLSFFAEDVTTAPIGPNKLEIRAGVRGMTLLNLEKRYTLRGKVYLDPRLNIQWNFPSLPIKGKAFDIALSGGIGMHTKMPVLAYLYPDTYYTDLVQLNYYHNNPDYRRLNVVTYEIDKTNYGLKAARNLKWELRADFAYERNTLSITYFRENMVNGFRNGSTFQVYHYKKYDTSGLNPATITSAPDISTLPYTEEQSISHLSYTTNGSRMKKEGVEFQYSSPRIPELFTRLTVNGAWLRTTYTNTMMRYNRPNTIINGATIKYVGVYKYDDGSVRESFNTNFIADTYIPKLKIGFSATFQCIWFTAQQANWKSGTPNYYVGTDGQVHPFTQESSQDTVLKHLIEIYSDQAFDRRTVPFEMAVNFKATKKIWGDKLSLALFVNRILNYAPDYTLYDRTIRRNEKPYFGMELNIKL